MAIKKSAPRKPAKPAAPAQKPAAKKASLGKKIDVGMKHYTGAGAAPKAQLKKAAENAKWLREQAAAKKKAKAKQPHPANIQAAHSAIKKRNKDSGYSTY